MRLKYKILWKLAFVRGVIKSIWYRLKYSNLPYLVVKFTPKYHVPVVFRRKGHWKVNEIIKKYIEWDKKWHKEQKQSNSN